MTEISDSVKRMLEKTERMASEMEQARTVSRDVVFRVVVLSATIVGFSATALSIESLEFMVDESRLRVSWLLFAAAVLVGPVALYLESRAQYAVIWRSAQQMEFDQPPATWGEKVRIVAVVLYTVLARPRNLLFVRDIDFGDPRRAWINGEIVQKLHVVWDVALGLELAFWLLFVAGLVTLMTAIT